MSETPTKFRVSSAELTRLQIAEAQAGCLGRWICEDSLGFVEFESQEHADRVLVAAVLSGEMEVTEAQADAFFRIAEALARANPTSTASFLARMKARLGLAEASTDV